MTKHFIGVEITENTLRMIACTGDEIKKTVTAELPDDLVTDGRILSMDAMADFMRETAHENGITKGNAAIVLPSDLVYVRNITIPAMTEQQLDYNLPFEFKDYLAEEKSKYIFDYRVIDVRYNEEGQAVEMDLLACAVLRSTIDEYRAMMRRAGFRLKIAVPEEYALSSALRRKVKTDGGTAADCYCIATIGEKETDLYFFHGCEYSFKRAIDYGIFDLEKRVAELLDVDLNIAHSYVRTNYEGVLGREECKEVYDSLAVEIMKAINFFNYNNRELELNNLFVGGAAAANAFCDAISNMTHLTIRGAEELMPMQKTEENPWMYLLSYSSTIQF